jgi:hypothetical protein
MPIRIDELTPEQEVMMPKWAERWIGIGLQTGDADFETFESAIKIAYQKAGIPCPNKIIHVQSPIVGALAASISRGLLQEHSVGRSNAVHNAVDNAVHNAVGNAVGNAVSNAVHNAVDNAVGNAVHNAVGNAVHNAVGNAVGNAVSNAVHNAVDNAVSNAVHNAVDNAVGNAVHNAVDNAVHNAVGNAVREWHDWFGGQFWVGYGWYGWGSPSFVSFFTDIAGLELSSDVMARAKAYRDLCTSVNYFWPNTHFVMVCDRPQFIGRDETGRLHNDQRKAIEYKDGWGLYALDGIVLQEAIWQQIVSQTMSFDEIVAIQDADVRAVALKYNKNAIIASGQS